MNTIERDLGRLQATQEIMKDDVKQIKKDLAEIKDVVSGANAVKTSDWKRLSVVGILFTIANQILTWTRPFV